MLVKYEPWHIGEEAWGIEIKEGLYKGTKISINKLEMCSETPDQVELDFNFVTVPKGMTDADMNSNDFNMIIEHILNDILQKGMDDIDRGFDEFENRNSNTSEPIIK